MRYPILAFLAAGYHHGYDLKQAFDQRFGTVWPEINVGQIYTTLARLERDGLVKSAEVEQAGRPNKRVYELTDEGRAALEQWVRGNSPGPKVRDEFFLKLVVAGLASVDDPLAMLDRQRQHYLQELRDLDYVASRRVDGQSPLTQLLIEGATLHIQADLKWLDLCEDYFRNGGAS